ncbi:High mobility group B protein 6 [Striga hermonthica]|uniref:High mobility group B protein 6 n=1 Tax=Striga hermonthica TaxID=68872 RepID=A0A9N7R143_STRHE|nr:High mobility group B protein 6 [Striga hermonthica]
MAAIAEVPQIADPAKAKRGKSRKALKQTSTSVANIIAATLAESSPAAEPPTENPAGKENQQSLSNKKTKKGGASKGGKKQQGAEVSSFEKELQEMQEKLEKLKLEKEHTEEMLKAKEESLKQKEEELETRDREQEKLKTELKKLQKMKEFNPTVSFPFGLSLKEQEQDKKDRKKSTTKKPSPPYVLWCKDQWNEVKKANPEADFKEMSTLLGSKWKAVTDEEKKPYEEKYLAQKEAYLKIIGNEKRENEAMKLLEDEHKQKTAMELLEQYLQFKQEAEKDNKKTKKEKDPLKPKQPMSAYFIFSNERRAALLAENKNILEIAKITGEEWKNMSEKQKEPYEKAHVVKKTTKARKKLKTDVPVKIRLQHSRPLAGDFDITISGRVHTGIYDEWIAEGTLQCAPRKVANGYNYYKVKSKNLPTPFDFNVACVTDKNWFYHINETGCFLDSSHLDVIFYYLRKFGIYGSAKVRYTTTDVLFDQHIKSLYTSFLSQSRNLSVCTVDDMIIDYITGYKIICGLSWFKVDHVLFPIHLEINNVGHWIMGLLSFDDMKLRIYNSIRTQDCDNLVMENVKAYVELIPIFLDLVRFPKKSEHGPLEVIMVDNVPQQLNSDCGIYVASFAEYFISGHDITKTNIDATVQRHRYGYLLYTHGLMKQTNGYESDDESPGSLPDEVRFGFLKVPDKS